ncbi:Metallo-dependent phosphatase-like protein [Pestalotiopsis sp. NC0098]|nr:Metallo-dependent phosphatase-like protein [Pestalotiopsis sp. NC0098]
MGLLQKVGLRRENEWESLTILDHLLNSPLETIAFWVYLLVTWIRGIPVRPPPNKRPIRVVCLSDTHDGIVDNVPDGDLLIHAGDLTNSGTATAIQKQLDWLSSLSHEHKVLIGGNHDCHLDKTWRFRNNKAHLDFRGIELLDSGVAGEDTEPLALDFDGGRRINIWGSSRLPRCGADRNNAFMYDVGSDAWNHAIPRGTEILVTHTPPAHHLDLGLGCPSLLRDIWRVQPKLHIFGHVHCGRGTQPVYWDDCQRVYERLCARQPWLISKLPIEITALLPRALIDVVPSYRWIDTAKVIFYGFTSLIWYFIMQGGRATGHEGLLVNAACQERNTGRLSKKSPFVVEI